MVSFYIPLNGKRIRTILITTPEKTDAIGKALRKIHSERAVLGRAFARLSKAQRKAVGKYLNIPDYDEVVLNAILRVINKETA